MNHLIRVILIVGLSVAAVLIILFSTGHFGPQEQMDAFVARTLRTALGQDVEIEQYVEASLPQRFQPEMVKARSHEPAFYTVTLPSALGQPISTTRMAIPYPFPSYARNTKPLNFPPEDLWCVRLKSADPTIPRVVLIAFHKDMYTASWVPHEPTDVAAVLAAVGCKFSNQ